MVGVPGKYKGCETCRRRRVKCTNERPHCQKCIGSGRKCEGYEREMVFITGTPEMKGRVASHPKKDASSSSSKKSSPMPESRPWKEPEIVPLQPLTSAWNDYVSLSRHGVECHALLTALQVPLHNVVRKENHPSQGGDFQISMAPYTPTELPLNEDEDGQNATAQCLVHVSSPTDGGGSGESYCAFLFEQNIGAPQDPYFGPHSANWISRSGPANFVSFPNHHFFVRVYRPLTLSIALLSRRSTFLSQPEWTTIPWEKHPKSKFDLLLDIMAVLPALFERTDRILPLQATVMRRFEAQEVLYNCLALERQFAHWVETIDRGFVEQAYWSEEMAPSTGYGVPFTTSYAFRDGITGLMYLHYWMALILLHRCIDTLHRAIFEPVLDSYPNMWPDASPTLQIDPTRYQQTRELAGKVCRGLDSTLNSTVQPDMLLAPMTVALDLYRNIDAAMHNCGVEIMWLQGFRDRLVARGQQMASVLQSNKWAEVAKFS